MVDISNDHLANWLDGAARYFENRDTGGEDMAHWSNVFSAERCREAAKRLRLSAQQREPVVRVKELRWYPVDNRPATRAEALSAIGLYIVADLSGDGRFAVGLDNGACAAFLLDEAGDKQLRYATIDEAKSAAQADYEQRIRAAIEVVAPSSTVEPTAHNSLDAGSSPAAPTISDGGSPGPSPLAVEQTSSDPASGRSQPSPDVSVEELLLRLDASQKACFDAGLHIAAMDIQSARALLARYRVGRR